MSGNVQKSGPGHHDDTVTISVIVPVFNTGEYVSECITSILKQSFTDFELIIVDDGSTDTSGETCARFAESDSRTRVIRKENGGVSSARNAGICAASGKYITFIDSDDILLDGALEYAAGKLEESGSDMLALGIRKMKGKGSSVYDPITDMTGPPEGTMPRLAIGGCFFRLSVIKEHGIRFTEGLAYSEDRVFIFSFAPYCRKLTACPRIFYIYRSNDGAATSSRNGTIIMENQFKAAGIMFSMSTEALYASFGKQLDSQARRAVKWGIYAIVKHCPGEIRKAKDLFFMQFHDRYRHPHLAWMKLVITRRILVTRRHITQLLRDRSSY